MLWFTNLWICHSVHYLDLKNGRRGKSRSLLLALGAFRRCAESEAQGGQGVGAKNEQGRNPNTPDTTGEKMAGSKREINNFPPL